MVILVLGDPEDRHAAHIYQALQNVGVSAYYLHSGCFPATLGISLSPDRDQGILVLPDGDRLPLDQIHAVYWRTFSSVQVPLLEDAEQHRVAMNDATSALRSLLQWYPTRWVNSWQAYQFHQEKPLQLRLAQQLGVTIPATQITNDPQTVLEFCQAYDSVIFKPVRGGAHTKQVTPAHLDPERLAVALRYAPVTLQEYIPGTNIRTYVIGDWVGSAEIASPSIDFRDDREAELRLIDTPPAIAQQCRTITHSFGMIWTAIDWRRTPEGRYVFLEANFSPMFLHFERQTGLPITKTLLRVLMQSHD